MAELEAKLAAQQELLNKATAALDAVVQQQAQAPQPPAQAPDPSAPPAWAQQFMQAVDQRFQHLAGWQQQQVFAQTTQTEAAPPEVVKAAQELMAEQQKIGRPIAPETAITHAYGIVGRRQHAEKLKAQAAQAQFNQPMPTFQGPRGAWMPAPAKPTFTNDAEHVAWLEKTVGDLPM